MASSAPLDWLDSLQASGIRPGLGRMRTLLRALGSPHRRYPSIIVAGTNGKGSTSATLASILNASGYRTALYTSPHLVELRERWQIAGAMIDPASLDAAIEKLRATAGPTGITPTYFEALTLLAFVLFEGCDVAVLEVGMGGRLDATNVVKPVAALITPIGLDHTEFLGNTIRKIAAEKAGVIHRGTIALTSNDDPVVLDVLRRRAAQFGQTLIHVTAEHDTPLRGAFQRRNTGLAVRAARELRDRDTLLCGRRRPGGASVASRGPAAEPAAATQKQATPAITEHSIAAGVAATRWRGRLERIERDGKTIWIDGGHNAHAVRAIVPFIEADVPRPRLLVFGIMRDKDVDAVRDALFPLFDRVITTEPYPPRSMTAAELGGIAVPDPADALRAAMAAPEPSIVVAGSLYLAGSAIDFFD